MAQRGVVPEQSLLLLHVVLDTGAAVGLVIGAAVCAVVGAAVGVFVVVDDVDCVQVWELVSQV